MCLVIGLREKEKEEQWESRLAPSLRGLLFPVAQAVLLWSLFLFQKSRRGQENPAANVKLHFKTLTFLGYRFIIFKEILVPSSNIIHHWLKLQESAKGTEEMQH